MSTMIFKEEDMLELCKVDAELIIKAYSINDIFGVSAIKNSILGFKNIIASHKGKFVPHLDLDYRFYVSNLLSLSIKSADEELKSKILSEIMIPSQITKTSATKKSANSKPINTKIKK